MLAYLLRIYTGCPYPCGPLLQKFWTQNRTQQPAVGNNLSNPPSWYWTCRKWLIRKAERRWQQIAADNYWCFRIFYEINELKWYAYNIQSYTNHHTYRPSAVMRIREISAGVPMKLPTAPAVTPIIAFVAKFGGFPSLAEQNKQVPVNITHSFIWRHSHDKT